MTVKLYDDYPYESEFDARITETGEDKAGFYVVLDKTFFFPEEGGQSPDNGSLNGVDVLTVKIRDDVVFHYVEKDSLSKGDSVHGKIDWEHRFSNMQMHTAEHIFSGLVHRIFSFDNVGFHLSDNSATMDYNGQLSADDVKRIEEKVNEIIYMNIPVETGYPDKETLSGMTYRLKKELLGPIRIVNIEGVDTCACCAPHVHGTAEIGVFKVVSFENYKGGTRIHYLAGKRAFFDYREKSVSLGKMSALLSSKPGEEFEKVYQLSEQNKKLSFDNVSLYNRLIESDILSGYKGQTFGLRFASEDEIPYMKHTIDTMRDVYKGTCFLFAGNDETGYRFMIETESLPVTDILTELKDGLNAKCGGKGNFASGSVAASSEAITNLLDRIGYVSG